MSLSNNFQVGELLKSARLITVHDLENAIQVATKTRLSVDRVVVMLGLVTSETAQAACDAHNMVRMRTLTNEAAAQALGVVASYRVPLTEALETIGAYSSDREVNSNQLGEILLRAELLTEAQLKDAQASSKHLSLPLGRILALKDFLPGRIVEIALSALFLMRDKLIDADQAVQAIVAVNTSECTLEDSLGLGDQEMRRLYKLVRLGEILVQAKLVSEIDMLTALELGIVERKPIGQMMLQLGLVSETLLDAGLKLQRMLCHLAISQEQAVQVLLSIHDHDIPFNHVIADLEDPQCEEAVALGLVQLLPKAQLLGQIDAEKSIAISYACKEKYDETLLRLGHIERPLMDVAIKVQMLLSEGLISMNQAIQALHYFTWSKSTLSMILTQFETAEAAGSQVMAPAAMPQTIDSLLIAGSWH